MKKIFLILFTALISIVSCAQKKTKTQQKDGHKIVFDIKGMQNDSMLLAYHYSGKHFISDTLFFNDQGIAILEDKENKAKGVYLAVFPSLGNKYFEFLISDQYFTIKTTKETLGKDIDFLNSPENVLFTSDMKEMNVLRQKSEKLKTELKTAKGKKKEEIEAKIKEINDTYIRKRDKLREDNPDMFYSKLLGLMKEIQIPEPPKKDNGELVDSTFGWKYLKNHYWDYTDFSEEGILRTPIFYGKLLNFITKRTEPIQDSVIVSCHKVLEKAKANDEIFKFTLVTLLNKYASSKIMGDDAVYVDLIDNYYAKGLAPWTDSTSLSKMLERANALRPLLIGKISPNLALRDTSLKMIYRLHDLPHDYTVVFVWDHECGHCTKSVPFIKAVYDKYGKSKNLMVYSISTINYEQVGEWKKYIQENNLNYINVADPYHETNFRKIYDISSTPQVFVLDKDKKIIAKRIGAQQLEEFLFNYFKRFDKEKFKGMEDMKFEKPDSSKTH